MEGIGKTKTHALQTNQSTTCNWISPSSKYTYNL